MKLFLATILAAAIGPHGMQRLTLLTTDAAARSWRSIHDRVMGGVSVGSAEPTAHGVRFEGRVSLANNGGFASFRREVDWPGLASWDGLRLRLRGDGRTYKLGLRTGSGDALRSTGATDWQAPFATRPGEWVEVELAFDDLVPTWRGRFVADAPPFDPTSVRELGILIADEQAGDFVLELASVEAWRSPEGPAGSPGAARRRTDALARSLDRSLDATELAEALRRRERALVVASPRGLDARSSLQLGRFHLERAAGVERDLRLVRLVGDEAGRIAGRTIDASLVRGLRDRWALPRDAWAVALVGKDGDVAARWSELVEPATVFDRIDRMPARRAELEERARERDTPRER